MLVLGLLIISINFFRSSMGIVDTVASSSDDMQKVSVSSLINYSTEGGAIAKGSDIVSATRYYADNPDVIINIIIGGTTAKTYTNTDYQTGDSVDFAGLTDLQFYEKEFQISISEGAPKNINYTEI